MFRPICPPIAFIELPTHATEAYVNLGTKHGRTGMSACKSRDHGIGTASPPSVVNTSFRFLIIPSIGASLVADDLR